MPDLQRMHRFRDHDFAGVNWRPTRFVDEVHSSRVCGLCRMIPKRTVLLPCDHALCQSCHAASFQGCGGRCPLDQEPFEEAECTSCDFPTRKANALKVYCWNEAHGCEYQGAMEDMLRHYENECTLHSVECFRCGKAVLHRQLGMHYVAGCTAGVSSARTDDTSSDSRALTLQDVRNALEEVKTLLRDPNHDHVLPAIQSQVNQLTEQVRNQESRLTEITGETAMPDLGSVHRFCDHPIEGVNWRPTRFVNELCISSVCALCGVISMSTALLPCSHFLCQSCLVASTLGCGGRCPLDQEPFEKGEWVTFGLPATTANALKVGCWNDVHGCEFEGSVEVMLKHYEKDCTFHTVQCSRCGENVLYMELPMHYVAGCSAAVPLAAAKEHLVGIQSIDP
ncbi:hypothetical protein MTO96_044648 [Rhipicephalus appendiculatus]